jgi:serine/threonine-protein kinase
MSAPDRLGPFTIRAELGRGGSGVVYAARWQDRDVALKVARDDLERALAGRFAREARLLARVTHPGVVPVLDAGTLDDGRPYLVMPLYQGETLAQRLERGALPLEEALALLHELAEALTAIHEAGLLHRDVKPENVFLCQGSAVLLDFGIAKGPEGEGTTTETGVVRGTVATMAPERFFGTPASVASDVYELAVTFYCALCGRLPWDEPQEPEARLAPRLPSEHGVELPEAAEDGLLAALSTRAERRPPSARAFAAALRAAVASRPPAAAAVTAPTLAPAPRPRRSLWLAAGVVALGGLAAVAWGRPDVAGARLAASPVAVVFAATRAAPVAVEAPQAAPVPVSAATAATAPAAAPAPVAPGASACQQLRDIVCNDPYTREGGWQGLCESAKQSLHESLTGSDATRADHDAKCRAALPAAIKGREYKLQVPKNASGTANMAWCRQLVAVWCDPELGALGSDRCAAARDRLTVAGAAERADQDQRCAQSLATERQAADIYRDLARQQAAQAAAASGKR